jgi:hypothetical protein
MKPGEMKFSSFPVVQCQELGKIARLEKAPHENSLRAIISSKK